MPNHTQGNGRNVALPDENRPSWRPQDENQRTRRPLSEEDDRYDEERYFGRGYGYWEDRDRRDYERDRGDYRSDRYGQGQSGYGSGFRSRNEGYPGSFEERYRERGYGSEDRSSGRGAPYYELGYNPERYGAQGGYGGGRGWEAERIGPRGYGYGDGDRTQYGTGGGMQGGTPSGFQRDEQAGRGATQQMQGSTGYQGYAGGGHRGKGPSGYQRSDERIREAVCEALTEDDRVDATGIEVTVKNGEVMLAGTVEDRRMKRQAEDCVENVSGVKDVQNHLRVVGERDRR